MGLTGLGLCFDIIADFEYCQIHSGPSSQYAWQLSIHLLLIHGDDHFTLSLIE